MNTFLPRVLFALVGLVTPILAAEPAAVSATQVPAASEKSDAIVVNVLGSVSRPGSYALPRKATLLDALGAAGGWTPTARLNQVSVVRGPAGESPSVASHDCDSILRGKTPNPKLEDRDSVFVPEKIF